MVIDILEKVQCKTLIIDFDYTITKKKSHTSIGVFGDILDISLRDQKEINGKADDSKIPIYMKYHWKKKIKLLEKYNACSYLKEASNLFYVNPNIKKILEYCNDLNIKVIILSSGYKPLIKYLLNKYNIKYDMLYASDDKQVITPLSKNKVIKEKYDNAVVVGDSIHDANMYKRSVCSIGICHDVLEYDKMKKHFDYVILENIKIINSFEGPKSTIGILENNSKRYFFKEKNENSIKEVEGFNNIKDFYKTSNLCIETDKYIIYEYIKELFTNTLNDYFYGKEDRIVIPLILNSYKNAMRKSMVLIDEKDTKTSKFFKGRLDHIEKLLKSIEYEKIIINKDNYEIKIILKDLISEIRKDKEVHAFLTNGSPTDGNITTNGYITDFENAGYNSVVSEIAILFVSFFTHGSYFYPKYNEQDYPSHVASLKTYNNYKPNIKYKTIKDTIYVSEYDFKINTKNKEVLLGFLEMYKTSPFFENYKNELKYLKYYIFMRLLTPITLDQMSSYDKVSILTLIIDINNKVKDLETLIHYIDELEEVSM